eukprot:SAG31_NODE_1402_length_8494_cov_4.344848_2_plen_136_part_00
MADGGSTPGQAQQNVNVAVRGRPPRTVEIDSSERPGSRPGSKPAECVTIGKDGDVQVGKHKKDAMHIVPRTAPRFTFDVAFGSKCSQQEVFEWVSPAVDGLFEGCKSQLTVVFCLLACQAALRPARAHRQTMRRS